MHAPYVISHEEEPARAARERDDASVVTAMRLVHEGRAEAAVSAGATGAVLAAGLLELRRLPGVLRPAIVQPLPSWKGPIVVLDIGATPDPRPNQLLQFAHMGTAFSASVLGVHEPRVGLLSNGHEEGKGNRLVIDSYRLLADDRRLRFSGNIEGRDVPLGAVDVVVTDGFTGNVVLKLLEGTGAWLFDEIRQAANGLLAGQARRAAAAAQAAPAAREGEPRHLRRLVPDRAAGDRRQGARRLGPGRDLERALARGARRARGPDRGHRGPRAPRAARAERGRGRGRRRPRACAPRRPIQPKPAEPCAAAPGAFSPHPRARVLRSPGRTSTNHGGTLATREEVLDQVKQILVQQLGVDEGQVTPEASFQDDLDADSLDLVELIMELEDQFGVKIPDEEAQGIKTVNQAVDYIMENAS